MKKWTQKNRKTEKPENVEEQSSPVIGHGGSLKDRSEGNKNGAILRSFQEISDSVTCFEWKNEMCFLHFYSTQNGAPSAVDGVAGHIR